MNSFADVLQDYSSSQHLIKASLWLLKTAVAWIVGNIWKISIIHILVKLHNAGGE